MSKKTKHRKPDLENLRLQLGYSGLAPKAGGPGSEDKQLVERYEDRFVKDGLTQDGKRIRIDERTGKPYNPSDAKRYINLNKYGTETPDEDFAYLNRKDVLDRKEKTGPMGIRRFFSEKGTGGSKFVDLEHAAYLKRENKELEQLKKKTSFAIDKDLVRQAEMHGGDENAVDFSDEYMAAMEADGDEDDTSVIPPASLTDEEQANQDGKVQLIKKQNRDTAVLKNEQYLKSIAGNGMNNTYTSDYREAIKADTGWKAFYDDSPDPNDPVRRSDVFTRAESDWGMYKEGDVLGVMGRSQRRAYDNAMHEAKMKSKHSLVQTPSPTWGVEGEKKSSKPNLVQTPSPTWGVGDGTPDPSVPAASKGETTFDPDKNRKKGGS